MIPSVGRIVLFKLHASHAAEINRRRDHARSHMTEHIAAATGVQVHVGNAVSEGDEFPLVITRVWNPTDGGAVNGQVLLDGNDLFWATSAVEGDQPGQWRVPPRVEAVPAPAPEVSA